ncbi:uncharacterized protein [Littorina saxatilis]|uniref:non-specific serine/threonine protein kinase n=1 Tax=Littorina saxatilis TaxID=31220 RepID=A0AAN9B947_9CAEN
MEQYETVERIGIGACGAVYLVRHVQSKRRFAMKKIEIDERRKTRTQQAVLKEASILSGLKHPNIVAFHDSFRHSDEQHVCIIQDYCDGGSLSDRIQEALSKNTTLPEKQIMQWFIQIVMAVQFIHSKRVLHRDLKSENVFLTKNNVVKVGDFGISKMLDSTIDHAKTVVGTPSYLSPELCQDIPYNSKSDIWALGCLLYEMCALHPPFDGNSLISLFFKIIKAEYEPVSSDYSEGVHDIITKILVKAPEDRPSASAILNMPFIKEHLSFLIEATESLKKLRSANTSMVQGSLDSSGDNSPLKFSSASPRISRKKADAANKLKCSPLAQQLLMPPETDLPSFRENMAAGAPKSKAEDAPDGNLDYSDDFDESSDSEIEEDIQAEKGPGSGATSEEEAQYADDFEEYDSAEELEEMLMQAREAQVLEPADDYFEDNAEDLDDMAETLTENTFITSRLMQSGKALEKKTNLTSDDGDRDFGASKEKSQARWKLQTFPNS